MTSLALLVALLLPAAGVQERTTVKASLSQPTISAGETAVLSITVETTSAADVHIKLPAFPASVMVTGSQEYSQTQFSIPGGRKRIVTREIALQVASPGTLEIPAIEIEVGGVSQRTRPLRLQVTGSAARSPGLASDEAWLRVNMRPDTVYVGEQATLVAEAGFSEDVRLRMTRQPVFELPSPTGFWAQDIPGGVRSQLRQVEGRVFEVQTLKRAYFPLTAGTFAFAPARIIVDVRQGFLYAPQSREIRSRSPRLAVLPLPEKGQPADFRGAVGHFTVRSSVEPRIVGVGEPVQLTLHVSGTGNVKAVPPPVMPQILGAEVFAPTESAETRVENETVGGTKSFTYVLIPERAGELRIPSVRFVFFDPVAAEYRILQTDSTSIRVTPGGMAGADQRAATALRPIRTTPNEAGLEWVRSTGFALLQLVPLLIVVVLLYARRAPKPVAPRELYLSQLHAAARTTDGSVYRELDRILRAALHEAQTPPSAAVTAAHDLLARIEAARFAPVPPPDSERADLVAQVESVLDALFPGKHRSGYAAMGLTTLALLAAAQSPAFQRGVQAYERADYARAATDFSTHIEAAPRDVSGWYNLGNAEHRLGETGNAVWAWASALRLQPRAGDITHNLRMAGAPEALTVRPPLAVRAEEWLLLAALLWWLAALFIILAVARRQRATPWLLAPLLLALVCAGVGVLAMRADRVAITLRPQTSLHNEPTVRSPVFRQARAGSLVRIVAERDEWLNVRTIDDRNAWVARDDVAEIKTE